MMAVPRVPLWIRSTSDRLNLKLSLLILGLAFGLGFSEIRAAEIVLIDNRDNDPESSVRIGFSGKFETGDFVKLASLLDHLRETGKFATVINLNSPGGSVSEAIKIGKLLRSKRLSTLAGNNESSTAMCASACALAWLGGIYRVGTVYVHRSYIQDGEALKFDTWDRSLTGSQEAIRQYLNELRAPQTVFQKILMTPSTTVTPIVSGIDIDVFDNIFDEYLIFHCGNRLEENQKTFLRLFDGDDFKDLPMLESMLLKALREKSEWQKVCGRRYLLVAQKEAQLN